MSEGQPKCISTLEIHPGGGSTSGSTVVATTGGSSVAMQTTSSFSSSSSQSSAKTISSSGSATTTKTVKSMTTTSKSMKSTSTVSKSSSSSRSVSIKSSSSSFSDSFGKDMGIDVEAEMKKLMSGADAEVRAIREKFFNLQPLALMGGATSDLVKLDSNSINEYVDKKNSDRLKFNFDVTEFESESISVKSDGNKIEVHAKKRSKKGDDEQSEEYSRTYELPTAKAVNPENVTSSFFKDGILTVELPITEAIDSK